MALKEWAKANPKPKKKIAPATIDKWAVHKEASGKDWDDVVRIHSKHAKAATEQIKKAVAEDSRWGSSANSMSLQSHAENLHRQTVFHAAEHSSKSPEMRAIAKEHIALHAEQMKTLDAATKKSKTQMAKDMRENAPINRAMMMGRAADAGFVSHKEAADAARHAVEHSPNNSMNLKGDAERLLKKHEAAHAAQQGGGGEFDESKHPRDESGRFA